MDPGTGSPGSVNRVKYVAGDLTPMGSQPDGHAATDGSDAVTFSMTVAGGETIITMRGDRDTAVIVRSESGERIYLPPEDFDRGPTGNGSDRSDSADSPYQSAPTDSPYQSAPTDSPYQSAPTDSPYRPSESGGSGEVVGSESPYQGAGDDSPYQAAGEPAPSEGLSPTADGYRIRHPEPVTDVRVLR
jgi:hypothetical protein